jgi:hypothetical protein
MEDDLSIVGRPNSKASASRPHCLETGRLKGAVRTERDDPFIRDKQDGEINLTLKVRRTLASCYPKEITVPH